MDILLGDYGGGRGKAGLTGREVLVEDFTLGHGLEVGWAEARAKRRVGCRFGGAAGVGGSPQAFEGSMFWLFGTDDDAMMSKG